MGRSSFVLTFSWKILLLLMSFSVFSTVLLKFYLSVKTYRKPGRTFFRNGSIQMVTKLNYTTTAAKTEAPHKNVAFTNIFQRELTAGANEKSPRNIKEKAYPLQNKSYPKDLKIRNKTAIDKEWTKFHFTIDTDIVDLVRRFKENGRIPEEPVFPYLYNFTFTNTEKCSGSQLLFIFLIKSAVGNYATRNAIRKTWAKDTELKKHNAVRKFLVGMKNTQLTFFVKKENEIHNNIVQMSFKDDYFNNTLKTIGGIHWVADHCNRTKFVVMVDDDMFVATSRVSQYLKVNISANTSFYGGFVTNHNPYRNNSSRWYVSRKDYPYDVYPIMPSGGFTIMSMPFVIDVHIASQYTKKFIFDDCYMGILAYRLRVKPTHIPTILMRNVRPRSRSFKTMLAAHGYNVRNLKEAWAEVKS